MDNSGDAQNPMFLVALLHQTFPQFAERDAKGGLKQQDANEAWLSLAQYLNMMKVGNRGYDLEQICDPGFRVLNAY